MPWLLRGASIAAYVVASLYFVHQFSLSYGGLPQIVYGYELFFERLSSGDTGLFPILATGGFLALILFYFGFWLYEKRPKATDRKLSTMELLKEAFLGPALIAIGAFLTPSL